MFSAKVANRVYWCNYPTTQYVERYLLGSEKLVVVTWWSYHHEKHLYGAMEGVQSSEGIPSVSLGDSRYCGGKPREV